MAGTLAVSVLTPGGRGAVATIAVQGSLEIVDRFFHPVNQRGIREQPIGRVVFGRWGREPGEDIVLCRVASDVLEIHCHGGDAAVAQVLDDLDCRDEGFDSWPAFLSRTGSVFDVEWTTTLTQVTTRRTLEILMQQRERFPDALRKISQHIDSRTLDVARDELDQILTWSALGRHLTKPWDVVLCGRPNAGKSSLVNALLGYQRAIVFDQPGTTRDIVTGETALEGWPIRFADTAGLRETTESLEAAGIERARRLLQQADACVLVCDVNEPPDKEQTLFLQEFASAISVAHKCDLPIRWPTECVRDMISVSSRTGDGVAELIQAILRRLIPVSPPANAAVPFTERQIGLLRQARAADSPDAMQVALTAIAS